MDSTGIKYSTLSQGHLELVAALVSDVFIRQEPTSVCLNLTWEVFHPFARAYCGLSCQAGLGVVALEGKTGNIAGAAICLDILDDVRDVFPDLMSDKYAPKLPDLAFVASIEGPFIEKLQLIPGQCAYNAQIAIRPDMQGMGIATALIREATERTRSHGFKMISAICTSPASINAHEKCGFRQEVSQPSATYKDANGENPYSHLSDACSLMVLRF